jgi:hypothetical protein
VEAKGGVDGVKRWGRAPHWAVIYCGWWRDVELDFMGCREDGDDDLL